MGEIGVFHNCTVVLELPSRMSFKDKMMWKRKITGNGGMLSYIVTKKVSFVILFEEITTKTSFKIRQCKKYYIPLLKSDFIDECLAKKKLLSKDKFIIAGLSENDDFKKGKIVGKISITVLHYSIEYITSTFTDMSFYAIFFPKSGKNTL